jgi:hypothetical protein
MGMLRWLCRGRRNEDVMGMLRWMGGVSRDGDVEVGVWSKQG